MGSNTIPMSQVKLGLMMWLPLLANKYDPETYRISGLNEGANDHPVLVIGKISDRYLIFLLCSGKYHSENEDLTVEGFAMNDHAPCECKELVKKERKLYFLPKDHLQPRHTHVNIQKVYLGSSTTTGDKGMLRQQFFVRKPVDAVLTPRSLELVMTKVEPALKTFKERLEIRKILSEHDLYTSWTVGPSSTTGTSEIKEDTKEETKTTETVADASLSIMSIPTVIAGAKVAAVTAKTALIEGSAKDQEESSDDPAETQDTIDKVSEQQAPKEEPEEAIENPASKRACEAM